MEARENTTLQYTTYQDMRIVQQTEFNSFPMFAAFNAKQFEDGMHGLGLEPNDVNAITDIGFGCFVRKTDKDRLIGMQERHYMELKDTLRDLDFAKSAFLYELSNHEYGYTGDIGPVLDALGLSASDFEANPVLGKALAAAIKEYNKGQEE